MADVWTRLLHGIVDFLEKRGEAYAAGSFASPKALIQALANGSDTYKDALTTFATTIGDGTGLTGDNKTLFDAVTKNITDAKTELDKVKTLLAGADFTLGNAKDSAVSIGKIVSGGLDSIGKIAKQAAGGNAATEQGINSIIEPWVEGFQGVASGATSAFDTICNDVLGVANASSDIIHRIHLDLADKRINITFANVGSHAIGPLSFDGAELNGYVQYDPPAVGVSINTEINAGLESDPFMNKIMPGGAKANSDPVAVQLDTDKGFSLGGGKLPKVVVPARLTLPFVELRELAMASPPLPNPQTVPPTPARIDIEMTIACKFGDVIGVIAEGVGVSLVSQDGGSWTPQPKQPDGLGITLKAGPISGGGYLRYDGKQYGGALQLSFGSTFSLSAVGLYDPTTNAFLVVIGVHFKPAIELGLGFTINGIGGLIASDHKVAVDQLSAKLKDGAVSNILMPDNPVASAPKILDQLIAIFPEAPGIFVVGPIVELGWGSESGLVTAKVGVLIQFPDTSVVILGSLQVRVPPKVTDSKVPYVVELNVDLFAALEPDEFFLKASILNSKIAGLAISGDLALLIKWGGDSDFAFSAGGFFPTYKYPTELAGLSRLSLSLSPPVPILKITVTAYIAVTSNSVQFGGAVDLTAKVGPASGEAKLSLDAMFVWSPRFAFIIEFSASVAIKVFDATIAGAAFRGTLQGTRPWSVEGDASISILFWDFDFHVGPIEWGDKDVSVLPLIDSLAEVMAAFAKDDAWTSLPPALDNAVTIARIADDVATALQPFSLIQANQLIAPFDTKVDRLGPYASTVAQFGFANPKINGNAAPAFSEVQDQFAIGQFKNLTPDQQATAKNFESHPGGIQMSPVTGTMIGTPSSATVEWDTCFPGTSTGRSKMPWAILSGVNKTVLAASAVAKARRQTGNPYAPAAPGPVAMADAGMVQLAPLATAPVVGAATLRTSDAMDALGVARASGQDMQIVALGLAA